MSSDHGAGLPMLISFRMDDKRRTNIVGEQQWHCCRCASPVCVSPSSLNMYNNGKWRDVICAQCIEQETGRDCMQIMAENAEPQPEQLAEIIRESGGIQKFLSMIFEKGTE